METGSLDALTQACRLLADGTRLRLLAVLETDALSVAELTQVTGLAQSRVSSHVSKLREAQLLTDSRLGASTLYSFSPDVGDSLPGVLWSAMKTRLDDDQIGADLERAREVILRRHATLSWADSVAGRMELHYSPGRPWEATARALIELLELGDVLDIASGDGVLAELLANHAKTVTCVDLSRNVVEAGRRRLAHHLNVRFEQADMHALPYDAEQFSVVFCMHALTYASDPARVIAEATRVLHANGTLIVATLSAHEHPATTRAYDHVNQGFSEPALRDLLEGHGLHVVSCRSGSREQRPPYFEVVIAVAKPA